MDGLVGHWWVIILILLVVLIVWGPGKMPDVGAGMGRAIHEFRNAMSGVHDTVVDATQMPGAAHHPAAEPSAPSAATPAAATTERPAATVADDTRPR
jgi:sec-independent protein translocase protein TatA